MGIFRPQVPRHSSRIYLKTICPLPSDRYKTAFTVPFGQFEWTVMPFGLKNAPSEFQKIMNDIFNPYSNFCIVYIDDVLIYSQSLDQHFKHLEIFLKTVQRNGLAISKTKINLFQTKIRFLGHNIHQGTIEPINRVIEFADKFPNQILDKTQLQRFLGCLNYVADFFPQLNNVIKPLHVRLKKNPPPWTDVHTNIIRQIKIQVKDLPCLYLPNPSLPKIVETDASDIGYGGILKGSYSYVCGSILRQLSTPILRKLQALCSMIYVKSFLLKL